MISFRGVPDGYRPSLTRNRLKWPQKRLALFYGPPGGGKSHGVVDLVYRDLKANGGDARFITQTGISEEIQMAIQRGESMANATRALKSVRILIIDRFLDHNTDLRDSAVATADDIISDRVDNHKLVTILISNSTPEWLAKNAPTGLASRLTEERGDDVVCEITSVSKLSDRPAPLGPWHVLPKPAWKDELDSLLADVWNSREGKWKTLAEIERQGKGITWALADRAKDLPSEAWDWLQQERHDARGVLIELFTWRCV